MIINSVAGHELVIRPPIATLCGCPRATRPREYKYLRKRDFSLQPLMLIGPVFRSVPQANSRNEVASVENFLKYEKTFYIPCTWHTNLSDTIQREIYSAWTKLTEHKRCIAIK